MSDKEKGAGKAAREEEQAPDGRINRMVLNLGRQDLMSHDTASFQVSRVKPCLEKLKKERFVERLWQKDAGLWKEDAAEQEAIRNALGWLDVAEKMRENLPDLIGFARQVAASGFSHVVHMGMGGSSLAPLVFRHMFEPGPGGLPLTVLDTTDPVTIAALESRDRPPKHPLYRGEQVGDNRRAPRLRRLFLRAREGRQRGKGGRELRRGDGPRHTAGDKRPRTGNFAGFFSTSATSAAGIRPSPISACCRRP